MKPSTVEDIDNLPDQAGIYKLYALSKNGLPIPIRRCGGIDHTGLLYVGRTKGCILRKRVHKFLATSRLSALTTEPSGAQQSRHDETIQAALGPHRLHLVWEACADCTSEEADVLLIYRRQFGEYPPLNS